MNSVGQTVPSLSGGRSKKDQGKKKRGQRPIAAATHERAATTAFRTRTWDVNGGRACMVRYNSVMSTMSTK